MKLFTVYLSQEIIEHWMGLDVQGLCSCLAVDATWGEKFEFLVVGNCFPQLWSRTIFPFGINQNWRTSSETCFRTALEWVNFNNEVFNTPKNRLLGFIRKIWGVISRFYGKGTQLLSEWGFLGNHVFSELQKKTSKISILNQFCFV